METKIKKIFNICGNDRNNTEVRESAVDVGSPKENSNNSSSLHPQGSMQNGRRDSDGHPAHKSGLLGKLRRFSSGDNLDKLSSNSSFSDAKSKSKSVGTLEATNKRKKGKKKKHASEEVFDSSSDEEEFTNELLREINHHRDQHGVKHFVLNKHMSSHATIVARKLANGKASLNKRFEKKYGKTVFHKKIRSPRERVTGKEVVDEWYSEIADYIFYEQSEDLIPRGSNFSQMLWSTSLQFGVGLAKSLSREILVVIGLYMPKGNIKGLYRLRVPPIGGFPRRNSSSSENTVSSKGQKRERSRKRDKVKKFFRRMFRSGSRKSTDMSSTPAPALSIENVRRESTSGDSRSTIPLPSSSTVPESNKNENPQEDQSRPKTETLKSVESGKFAEVVYPVASEKNAQSLNEVSDDDRKKSFGKQYSTDSFYTAVEASTSENSMKEEQKQKMKERLLIIGERNRKSSSSSTSSTNSENLKDEYIVNDTTNEKKQQIVSDTSIPKLLNANQDLRKSSVSSSEEEIKIQKENDVSLSPSKNESKTVVNQSIENIEKRNSSSSESDVSEKSYTLKIPEKSKQEFIETYSQLQEEKDHRKKEEAKEEIFKKEYESNVENNMTIKEEESKILSNSRKSSSSSDDSSIHTVHHENENSRKEDIVTQNKTDYENAIYAMEKVIKAHLSHQSNATEKSIENKVENKRENKNNVVSLKDHSFRTRSISSSSSSSSKSSVVSSHDKIKKSSEQQITKIVSEMHGTEKDSKSLSEKFNLTDSNKISKTNVVESHEVRNRHSSSSSEEQISQLQKWKKDIQNLSSSESDDDAKAEIFKMKKNNKEKLIAKKDNVIIAKSLSRSSRSSSDESLVRNVINIPNVSQNVDQNNLRSSDIKENINQMDSLRMKHNNEDSTGSFNDSIKSKTVLPEYVKKESELFDDGVFLSQVEGFTSINTTEVSYYNSNISVTKKERISSSSDESSKKVKEVNTEIPVKKKVVPIPRTSTKDRLNTQASKISSKQRKSSSSSSSSSSSDNEENKKEKRFEVEKTVQSISKEKTNTSIEERIYSEVMKPRKPSKTKSSTESSSDEDYAKNKKEKSIFVEKLSQSKSSEKKITNIEEKIYSNVTKHKKLSKQTSSKESSSDDDSTNKKEESSLSKLLRKKISNEIISKENERSLENQNTQKPLHIRRQSSTSSSSSDEKSSERLNWSNIKQTHSIKNSIDLDSIRDNLLIEINGIRKTHNVSPLYIDYYLCCLARKRALELLKPKEDQKSLYNYGENLYVSNTMFVTEEEIVDSWYRTGENYVYGERPKEEQWPFTQLIWKDTTEFGGGAICDDSGRLIVVALFNPEGNVPGEYTNQIYPPISFHTLPMHRH